MSLLKVRDFCIFKYNDHDDIALEKVKSFIESNPTALNKGSESSRALEGMEVKKKKNLLVICSQKENYFHLLGNRPLEDGTQIVVDQAPWVDIEVASYPDNLVVSIRPNRNPFPGTTQGQFRTFLPDFVLFRSYALGNHEHDWRRKIYAFYHNDIPCINSIDSFVWSVEKAIIYTKLRRVKKKVNDFPLIPQTYYSHPSVGSFPPDYPSVLKVGSGSQGIGKAKINEQNQWLDSLSLLHMTTEYFVTEPFIPWVTDVRVQKIGNNYRAIERRRMSDLAPWKANEAMGISEEDIPVKPKWKEWIDAAAEELDMDICGMDLIADKDGNEFILEVNSSSIGFPARHAAEDTVHICDLVIIKMSASFCTLGPDKEANSAKKEKVPHVPAEKGDKKGDKKKKKGKK